MKNHRNNNKRGGAGERLHGSACLWLPGCLREGWLLPSQSHPSCLCPRKQTKYQRQERPSRTSAYVEMHSIITMINAVLDKREQQQRRGSGAGCPCTALDSIPPPIPPACPATPAWPRIPPHCCTHFSKSHHCAMSLPALPPAASITHHS